MHPAVLRESHQNPQASPKDADIAQRATGKRQRGFAVRIRRKPAPLTGQLEATVGTKVMCYRSQYPRTHRRVIQGPLFMAPGNSDYSRKKRAKQRLNPKLILFA